MNTPAGNCASNRFFRDVYGVVGWGDNNSSFTRVATLTDSAAVTCARFVDSAVMPSLSNGPSAVTNQRDGSLAQNSGNFTLAPPGISFTLFDSLFIQPHCLGL